LNEGARCLAKQYRQALGVLQSTQAGRAGKVCFLEKRYWT
jgi:hypothetical protein